MRILMAAERSHRDPKWEHQVDTGSVLLFLSFLYKESERGACVKISCPEKREMLPLFLLLIELCNGEFEGGGSLKYLIAEGQDENSQF